jgi:hypothetical protein
MNEQVPRLSSIPPGREREIFEVLLSSPLLGAAEALALLGTCKYARGVGRAASLDAVRAVSTCIDGDDEYVVPHVYGSQSSQTRVELEGDESLELEEWFLESAVSVAEGASASITHAMNTRHTLTFSYLQCLGKILSMCPNVISMRIGLHMTREMGSSLATTHRPSHDARDGLLACDDARCVGA